jgi:hypothetical protein
MFQRLMVVSRIGRVKLCKQESKVLNLSRHIIHGPGSSMYRISLNRGSKSVQSSNISFAKKVKGMQDRGSLGSLKNFQKSGYYNAWHVRMIPSHATLFSRLYLLMHLIVDCMRSGDGESSLVSLPSLPFTIRKLSFVLQPLQIQEPLSLSNVCHGWLELLQEKHLTWGKEYYEPIYLISTTRVPLLRRKNSNYWA